VWAGRKGAEFGTYTSIKHSSKDCFDIEKGAKSTWRGTYTRWFSDYFRLDADSGVDTFFGSSSASFAFFYLVFMWQFTFFFCTFSHNTMLTSPKQLVFWIMQMNGKLGFALTLSPHSYTCTSRPPRTVDTVKIGVEAREGKGLLLPLRQQSTAMVKEENFRFFHELRSRCVCI
jgi:hypothetical protein